VIFSVVFFIWIKPFWINTIIDTNLESKIIPTFSQALKDWILEKKEWIILNPLKWSIAEKNGIKQWDLLVWLKFPDKSPIKNFSLKELQTEIQNYKWKNLIFCILEENKKWVNTAKSISIKIPNSWKIWVYIQENIKINKNFKYKFSLVDSIKYWFKETYIQSILTLKWLKILLNKIINPQTKKERQEALNQMSWPIWIVDFISSNFSAWIIFLSILTAIISINLWIFNLLPIPALDWWRWFLLTINTILEKITFWKINIFYLENFIHLIFFIILIALSILIWYNDVTKIINR
jgi:hypothetical protein